MARDLWYDEADIFLSISEIKEYGLSVKKIIENLNIYKKIVRRIENPNEIPIFNLEAVQYYEPSEGFIIHASSMLFSMEDAILFLRDIERKNVYILDYYKAKYTKNEFLDFIAENRNNLLYTVACLASNGFYFFDSYSNNWMSDILYSYVFDLLHFTTPVYDDFKEFYGILLSPLPAAGLRYIRSVLENNIEEIINIGADALPFHLALMFGMHLEEASTVDGVVLAGVHGDEDTVLDHALNVLDRVSLLTQDPLIRYAAFFHDIGKIKAPYIIQNVLDIDLYEYMHLKNHYQRGRVIMSAISEILGFISEERRALMDVAYYHGKLAKSPNIKLWSEIAHKAPLSYECLRYVVTADSGVDFLE